VERVDAGDVLDEGARMVDPQGHVDEHLAGRNAPRATARLSDE
jgi:hypothetical protein